MSANPSASALERVTFTGVSVRQEDDDEFDFTTTSRKRQLSLTNVVILLSLLLSLVAVILAIAALVESTEKDEQTNRSQSTLQYSNDEHTRRQYIQRDRPISRIAFGSCTTYYPHPEPIWTNGVIPSDPDMWIWMGDLIYMDDALVNCKKFPKAPECMCEITLMTYPPYSCRRGNITHSRERVRIQLLNHGYRQFLQYMCPDFETGPALAPDGVFCEKPILGTYDDHDYGINNGDRLFADKYAFKNLFLDAIGEPQDSPRRSNVQGLQVKYTLNPEGPADQKIDVFLLDERYERDPLPCGIRKEWCKDVFKNKTLRETYYHVWCTDFLKTGGHLGGGSCCRADDEWANGWCKDNTDSDDPLWDIACDPSSPRFGSTKLEFDKKSGSLISEKSYDSLESANYVSNFCDVLGSQQRMWLQSELQTSSAPLKIVVSGSVLFGNPIYSGINGPCSGDDIECYKVAQANLMHMIGGVETGCVVVLAGDYHFSDLKVLEPNSNEEYSKYYPLNALKKPIYQVMSSGLTEVTAGRATHPQKCDTYRNESSGMRPFGECSFVGSPAFGMMEIDWEAREVRLQHRSPDDGSVTEGVDKSRQEIVFDLDTCKML